MAEALILESFVTAIACLCASSYGPNTDPDNFKYTITDTISTWDKNVFQIFLNSNHKFSFNSDSEECAIPESGAVDLRLAELESEVKKQKQLIAELGKAMNELSDTTTTASTSGSVGAGRGINLSGEMAELRAKVETFTKDIIKKDETIAELRVEIKTLRGLLLSSMTTTTKKPTVSPTKSPAQLNTCIDKPHGANSLKIYHQQFVFCDQTVNLKHGKGWMLITQRLTGNLHFYRNWAEYTEGFGVLKTNFEFFLGLQRLNALTTSESHELLIILTDSKNVTRYAQYDNFLIGSEKEYFALKQLGKYSGDAGDSLTYHVGQKFSTFDKDNDSNPNGNCAAENTGAWWYKNCHRSNLFGIYRTRRSKTDPHALNGMIWGTFHNTNDGDLNTMKMYLRPKSLRT